VTFILREARGDADLEASLAVYNEVFPRDAVSVDEAKAFYASTLAFVELIAEVDGVAAGSGLGALRATDPGVALAIVAVRPDARRRGIGSALFD
jgi:GNAT superfamily N-acetyltransferase